MLNTQFFSYKNKSNVTRINALHIQNTYCEGIAVRFNACNHLQENVMVVSNKADALFYYMIAANKRH